MYALPITRAEDFPAWYQAVVREADMAEASPVRGCMVIKPWGYGIWELMQRQLDDRIKELGFENCYFPIFVPMSFFLKKRNMWKVSPKRWQSLRIIVSELLAENSKSTLIPNLTNR